MYMDDKREEHIKNPAAVLLGKLSAAKRKARSKDFNQEMRELRKLRGKRKSTSAE